jgi:uncharacterized iron-regulated protein
MLRLLVLACAALAGCRALGPDHRIVDPVTREVVSFDDMLDELQEADVVFLGELHDSVTAHRLQLAVTRALHERRGGLTLSLEMFERDAQSILDLYLEGAVPEVSFLGTARPWPDYARDYRPAVEYARAHGLPVLAANAFRPLAARVARAGLAAGVGDPWGALHVDAGPGEYRDRFLAEMGDHGTHGGALVERFFEAQCLKDDAMAESIAVHIAEHGPDALPVVHWCGRFHSDFRLGTVERLARRCPDLTIAVISSVYDAGLGRAADPEDARRADFVWYIRPARRASEARKE